ncbi:MotE family protein [Hyphobacterium sp.]|uniref:MotE family protein n=1 Tax=Hyphobacterium sp. TaxID=2004662 RepID=UPI003BAA7FA9
MKPVRVLATAAILAGGLFILKALEVGVSAADAFATRSVEDEPAEAAADEPQANPLAENSLGTSVCEAPDEAGTAGSFAMRAANAGLSPSERDILSSLVQRRAALDARDRELDTREQLLEVAESRVDERIEELRQLQADIDALLGNLSELEAEEMRRLVAIYNQMEPDAAAERIAALDLETQVQIISRMTARQAGPIMAEMEVRDAAALTSLIAARRDVPETAAELEARLGSEG